MSLLGGYLATVHEGEVRKRDLIPHLIDKEEQPGYHAYRVMASYEHWLAATPELDLLYLMGLFDRPAAKGAIDALLAPPVIAGLTANLQNLPFAKLQFVLHRLRDLRLLAEKDKDRPDTLDCHPLVREYFGEKLRQQNPAAWKEAHSRLYQYYRGVAKEFPDSIEEMTPLYAAVGHGCQAGHYEEALNDIFRRRILRGRTHFSRNKLNAFNADLAALSNFFSQLWDQVVTNLSDSDKYFVLTEPGFYLRVLGRLNEAELILLAGLEFSKVQQNWEYASRAAVNLSELNLTRGKLESAMEYSKQSIEFADRSEDAFLRMYTRTSLADALHQGGFLSEAEVTFDEAEKLQEAREPQTPLLYSGWGSVYCDLLLTQEKYQKVIERVSQTLKWAEQKLGLRAIALDRLSLGRSYLLKVLQEGSGDFTYAATILDQAVDGLRQAGRQEEIPRGLFARAACYRAKNEFAPAWADLEEAREIAERGEMKLFLADYHLEASRVCLAEGKMEAGGGRMEAAEKKKREAEEHLRVASEMIEEMGYGRRKPEVEELRKQLAE